MIQNVFLAMGGLGLLLFGIKMVSTGLQLVAGDQLQAILKKATSNRFVAAVVGIIVTIAINSSTAVSVITVGFVNAGLMNLTQAIGVLLGINVGTTFSAHLIAFRIDQFAPVFMIIGVVMYLFFKKKTVKNVGYVILGFGILFFSITVMGDALRVFRTHPAFIDTISSIQNPLFALFIGFIFTVVIQSSSATMGLLVTMHLAGVPIPFQASAFIILGANIGTSVTAVIASLPASRDSRRAALFHITYDLIGSVVFGSLILIFPGILAWFQTTWVEGRWQVAMFHTLYNVATLMLLIPFVSLLAKLMQTIIPLKADETREIHERKLIYLDSLAIKTSTVAVVNAHSEANRMAKIVKENITLALESFFERDEDKANKVFENEKIVDFLHQGITDKLIEINNMSLSASDAERIGAMFGVLSGLERIGDYAENIAKYAVKVKDRDMKFTDAAVKELKALGEISTSIISTAFNMYENLNDSQLPQIETLRNKVDKLASALTKNHVKRLKSGKCKPRSGIVFIDIVNDLERSADQAEDIAKAVWAR